MNKLISIKILFGGDQFWNKEKQTFTPEGRFDKRFYNEIIEACKNDWVKESLHFVFGENNKTFLLANSIPENNIILVNKKSKLDETSSTIASMMYNKTFLMNYAAENLSHSDVLFTDYDCSCIKKFDKQDIHNSLAEGREIPLQTTFNSQRQSIFQSVDGTWQKHGVQTCLVFWRDKSIINRWLKVHQENPFMAHDEPPLLLALEQIYGKISRDDLYEKFNTKIIRTRRKQRNDTKFIREKLNENPEDVYFYHR